MGGGGGPEVTFIYALNKHIERRLSNGHWVGLVSISYITTTTVTKGGTFVPHAPDQALYPSFSDVMPFLHEVALARLSLACIPSSSHLIVTFFSVTGTCIGLIHAVWPSHSQYVE